VATRILRYEPGADSNTQDGGEEHPGGMVKELGPWLIGGGIVLLVAGFLTWSGALSWLGNLPGDIRITTENARIYIPITSMLLVSVVLNVLIWLLLWLFHR
jgi:hypothetical protein